MSSSVAPAEYEFTKNRFLRFSLFVLAVVSTFATSEVEAAGPHRTHVNLHEARFAVQREVVVATALPTPQIRFRAPYTLTAYTSIPGLTDNSPFITASGARVHEGTVAANCFAFGTRIRIPELFGERIFVVEDRLHPRKGCGLIDIWLPTYDAAKRFGVKFTTVEVLE